MELKTFGNKYELVPVNEKTLDKLLCLYGKEGWVISSVSQDFQTKEVNKDVYLRMEKQIHKSGFLYFKMWGSHLEKIEPFFVVFNRKISKRISNMNDLKKMSTCLVKDFNPKAIVYCKKSTAFQGGARPKSKSDTLHKGKENENKDTCFCFQKHQYYIEDEPPTMNGKIKKMMKGEIYLTRAFILKINHLKIENKYTPLFAEFCRKNLL